MNKVLIIGNLTRDPELRSVKDKKGQSISVCDFTVAVNKGYGESKKTDFFKVTTWRGLADTCHQYLSKGKKVYVSGPIEASAYISKDGEARANLEINAEDIEFLSNKTEAAEPETIPNEPTNIPAVETDEEIPF